jgi:hypothetical protein
MPATQEQTKEFITFEKLKRKKYMPFLAKSEHGSLSGE